MKARQCVCTLWRGLINVLYAFYTICYKTGIQTLRCLRFASRRFVRGFAPAGRLACRLWELLAQRHIRAIAEEGRRFTQGFSLAKQHVKAAYARGFFYALWQVLLLPYFAVRRHCRVITGFLNLAAPVAAAVFLVVTIQSNSAVTFGLVLEYNGEQLGYITDERVFDEAAHMAAERVVNIDNAFQVERVPKLTIAVLTDERILDQNALCDEILRSSGDSIAEACGLYIDKQFEGAAQSREELEKVLTDIKAPYANGSTDERVEFIQNVEVTDGLYPVSSVTPVSQLQNRLTSQSVVEKHYTVEKGDTLKVIARRNDMTLDELRALNPAVQKTDIVQIGQKLLVQRPQPYLRVQTVRTLRYTEEIPFPIEKTKDSKQFVTYEKIKAKGVNGSQDIVAELVLVDGLEQSRQILSTTVTKEPVTQQVIVGSKPKVSTSGVRVEVGDGVATGRFMWPVPVCHNFSRGFRGGHGALDICNGPVTVRDKPYFAADGGEVIQAGYSGGYGNVVIVRHANGYETLYAHARSLNVVKGQKVTKGQQLGIIGSTGNSTGPHLHFEVRLNGRRIDPMQFFR